MLKQTIVKWAVAAALATPIAPILASTTTTRHPAAAVTTSVPTRTPEVKMTGTTKTAHRLSTSTKTHTKLATIHRRPTTNSRKLRGVKPLVAKHAHHTTLSTSKHSKPVSSTMSLPGSRSLPSIDAAGQRT